ncbi:MAG: GNAT family N-acetyltransferase [Bacteroidetes bacterium]|nr:GNAT family N-acetyltransferase [Bacteroidota bacterium]
MENLFALYTYLGRYQQISIVNDGPFNIITSEGNEWPSMVYNQQGELSTANLVQLKKTLSRSTCKTLILKDSISDHELSILKELRFMPVTRWYNMSKQLTEKQFGGELANLDVCLCDTIESIEQWISVASKVLFKGQLLPKDVLLDAVKEGKFKLLLGKTKDTPVSTLMVYCGDEAGIYMVATEQEQQKKGFGKIMMSEAEKLVYNAGYRCVCLHATQVGMPLYTSLGYQAYNSLILFYNFN